MGIKENLNNLRDDLEVFRPTIFDLSKNEDVQTVEQLMKDKKISSVVDDFEKQQHELWLVKNPESLRQKKDYKKSSEGSDGVWVYYPWHHKLVHCLYEDQYSILRLSRNRDLINEEEQKIFGNLKIGFAGLNVGNPITICVALEGGAQEMMKLADNDTLDFSNLNRFRGVCDLGVNKAVLTARQVYEINPFAETEVFSGGVDRENIDDFLTKPKIDILVEETDDLRLKVEIRKKARENGIPVVMITGNGAGVIVDIERFDKDKNLPILNGYLKEDVMKRIEVGSKSFEEKVALARDFMGKEHLTPRLNQSFDLIGTKLVGIPQISEASYLRGAVVCNAIRNIFNKDIQSGRYFFDLGDLFKK